MPPQISYTPSNFHHASAASPCSPLTSSFHFMIFFIFVSFLNLLLLLHSDGGRDKLVSGDQDSAFNQCGAPWTMVLAPIFSRGFLRRTTFGGYMGR